MVAIVWAWINYSWFASAFDTDDWLFRVLTMVQMAGVVVLAIGLPPMFASLERGQPVENEIMVAGYVVMRVFISG
ncbi:MULTISPECIES: low temperature requirement protein A [unclassified Microbacterium]|uniref:low temperature requirement protein A n=1 Tax=unclassified Microbacterium TaxID=2609290 RepID=UPI00269A1134|nr:MULTISPECIES: low temperature requirement protein A [unclassified Microbacterium]